MLLHTVLYLYVQQASGVRVDKIKIKIKRKGGASECVRGVSEDIHTHTQRDGSVVTQGPSPGLPAAPTCRAPAASSSSGASSAPLAQAASALRREAVTCSDTCPPLLQSTIFQKFSTRCLWRVKTVPLQSTCTSCTHTDLREFLSRHTKRGECAPGECFLLLLQHAHAALAEQRRRARAG